MVRCGLPILQHLKLLTLELWLSDGSTLHYEDGNCVIEPVDPGKFVAVLKHIINIAHLHKGCRPALEGEVMKVPPGIEYFGVTVFDDRASTDDRYTDIEFLFSGGGEHVVGFRAASQPGDIYVYVYGQDVAEVSRDIRQLVIPLLLVWSQGVAP